MTAPTEAATKERLERLRERLAGKQTPAALVLDPVNVGYLTGFTGSTAALLVTGARARLITDSRYAIRAREECPGWEIAVIPSSATYDGAIAQEAEALGIRQLAFEAEFVTVARRRSLGRRLRGIRLRPATDLVAALRRVKDAEEVRRIRAACVLADRAFERLAGLLRPGVTERETALELAHHLRKLGADAEAFPIIVAAGPNAAMPHARPGERRLRRGDLVIVDYGARRDGYVSDVTRTLAVGTASARQRAAHAAVLDALESAKRRIRTGVRGREVDALARRRIGAHGFAEQCFQHGLGHGIGLAVHDHPALGATVRGRLQAGMVVTVEPAIYVEGWGGVRIEDDVLVTEEGCETLTHAPRELIELRI